MDSDSVLALGSLLLAVGLLIVTWRYAKSTEEIARETTNAAAAARTTAQINLLQSLLAVQPVLEVSGPRVEYWHGETSAGPSATIPFSVSWSVTNAGSGIAFNPEFTATIGDVDLPVSQTTERISQLAVGHTLKIAHQTTRSTWMKLASYVAEGQAGQLHFACRDAHGASIELRGEFRLDGKEASLTSVNRTYEGGKELKAMLADVLEILEK